jgi:hypothetical protein
MGKSGFRFSGHDILGSQRHGLLAAVKNEPRPKFALDYRVLEEVFTVFAFSHNTDSFMESPWGRLNLPLKLDPRYPVFLHAVGPRPEIGFTGIEMKHVQQGIVRRRNTEIFNKRPLFNAPGPHLHVIIDKPDLAGHPHDFIKTLGIEVDFHPGIFPQLPAHGLDGLRLEIKPGLIGVPHAEAPYARLGAFRRGQIAHPVFISEVHIFLKIHFIHLQRYYFRYRITIDLGL